MRFASFRIQPLPAVTQACDVLTMTTPADAPGSVTAGCPACRPLLELWGFAQEPLPVIRSCGMRQRLCSQPEQQVYRVVVYGGRNSHAHPRTGPCLQLSDVCSIGFRRTCYSSGTQALWGVPEPNALSLWPFHPVLSEKSCPKGTNTRVGRAPGVRRDGRWCPRRPVPPGALRGHCTF